MSLPIHSRRSNPPILPITLHFGGYAIDMSDNPDRSKRVKDARSEAQKEIEEYRQQKEDEFQKFEKEVPHPSPISLTSIYHLFPLILHHPPTQQAIQH